MSLVEQVNEGIKNAMKNKEEDKLRALRAIKSAILLAQTEKGKTEELTEEQETKLLQKLVKQRKESLEIYQKQNRADLAQTEQEELVVIEAFLPAPLTEEQVYEIIKNIALENGFKSPADMGKLMPLSIKAIAGQADGKIISELVKKVLSEG